MWSSICTSMALGNTNFLTSTTNLRSPPRLRTCLSSMLMPRPAECTNLMWTDLDEFTFLYDETGRRTHAFVGDLPYFLRYRDGHYFSVYPPGPALLTLPLYVLPVIAGMPATSAWVVRLEKF